MSAEPFFCYPSGVRGSRRRCPCSAERRGKPGDPRAPVARRLVSWWGEQPVADPQGWGAWTPLRLEALSDTCAPSPVHEKSVARDTQQESVRHALTGSTTHCCRGLIHFISFHFISFHFISFHFISFHFISFHFISFHFISFHFISFHFISFHFISFHFISFHFISFHFISFHFISFHFISFHFISFHSLTHSLTQSVVGRQTVQTRQTRGTDTCVCTAATFSNKAHAGAQRVRRCPLYAVTSWEARCGLRLLSEFGRFPRLG